MSDPLSFSRLREANATRCHLWCKGKPRHMAFSALELIAESGEACDVVKKIMRAANGEAGGLDGQEAIDALANELADVVICADLLADSFGIDLGMAVRRKFNRTSKKHFFNVYIGEEADRGE